jgi:hypothetical protein
MANNGVLDSEKLVLFNQFGAPNPAYGLPYAGFTGASHHNVATAAYPLGTVIQVYNTGVTAGVAGYSQFVYGKLETQDATNVVFARCICTLHSDAVPTDFTNDNGADIGASNVCVIAISDMETDYYGWFWCGGVCPEEFVADLGGFYNTDDTVAVATPALMLKDAVTAGTTAGEKAFTVATAGLMIVGMTLADDSAI